MTEPYDATTLTLEVVTPGMTGTHQIFRREFPLTSDLIRSVEDGDEDRIEVLAKHLRLVLDLVQVHHDAEERYIWSSLPERAPASREIVQTMLEQHAHIHEVEESIDARLARWRDAADTTTRDALADAVEAFTAALVEHAALEEGEPLAFIAENLTMQEWLAFVSYASTAMPEDARPLVMGMLMEDMPAPAREAFLSHLPEQLGTFLRTTGADIYKAYVTSVRGA